MALQKKDPARLGAAGPRELSFSELDNPKVPQNDSCAQAQFAAILRFPPRPRRIEARISATDARAPIGRTRPLRLTEPDFLRLVEAAVRLEARR
jgi:hypothetical protein